MATVTTETMSPHFPGRLPAGPGVEDSGKGTAFGNLVGAKESDLSSEDREIFRGGSNEPDQLDKKRTVTVLNQEVNGVADDKEESVDILNKEIDDLMGQIKDEVKRQFPDLVGKETTFQKQLDEIANGSEHIKNYYNKMFKDSVEELNEAFNGLSDSVFQKMYLFNADSEGQDSPEDLFCAYGLGVSAYPAQADFVPVESVMPSRPQIVSMFEDLGFTSGNYGDGGAAAVRNESVFYPPSPQPVSPERTGQTYATYNGVAGGSAIPGAETLTAGHYPALNMPGQPGTVVTPNGIVDSRTSGEVLAPGVGLPGNANNVNSPGAIGAATRQNQTVEIPGGYSGNVPSAVDVNAKRQLSESARLEDVNKQEESNKFERKKKCLLMLMVFSKLFQACPDWLKGEDKSKEELKSKCSDFCDKVPGLDKLSEAEQLKALKNKREKLKVMQSYLAKLSVANDWMNKIKLFADKKEAIKKAISELGNKSDVDALISSINEKNKATMKMV